MTLKCPYPVSSEEAILAIHPLQLGRAPALPGGAFCLFHVINVGHGQSFEARA